MSLILDALRRAESERERGSIPGLHAQPVPPLSIDAAARPRAGIRRWIAISLAVLLLALLGGYVVTREAQREIAAAPPRATPVAAPIPAAVAPPPVMPAAPAAEPAPWPSAEPHKAPAKAITDTTTERASATAPPTAAAEPPIHSREQLPENIRAELPPLAIGGSIYSANPAARSVVIDGRIYRESDRLTADLLLEQIRFKAAVLSYKGYRFEIPF